MQNIPSNFNWRESPPHLDLLSKFIKPRDTQQVISWQYIRQTLKENPETTIERFIRDGMLVSSSTGESLECLFQIVQLKRLLEERNLKVSGRKSDLIERLILADQEGMNKIIQKYRILKCSPEALEILSEYEKKKQLELDIAKQLSYEALKNNNPKDAYKTFVVFQRTFIEPGYASDHYQVEELQNILKSRPKILAGMTYENLRILKAAVCMKLLWFDEHPETWLPNGFSSGFKNIQVAVNYLTTHARIKREVDMYKSYSKKIRIAFYPGDIDSCELCQSLNGKIFEIDQVPELPMIGCTSEIGCQCEIENVFDENQEDDSIYVSLKDDNEIEDDPVNKLRQLNQMLSEELITRDEYEEKRKEILSRL